MPEVLTPQPFSAPITSKQVLGSAKLSRPKVGCSERKKRPVVSGIFAHNTNMLQRPEKEPSLQREPGRAFSGAFSGGCRRVFSRQGDESAAGGG